MSMSYTVLEGELTIYVQQLWAPLAKVVMNLESYCNNLVMFSYVRIRVLSPPTTRYNQEPTNHHCQTQSVQDACIYLDTYPELTPPRITWRHYGPVSQACRRTGRGDLTSQDRHSCRNSGGWSLLIQSWPGIGVHRIGASSWNCLQWWQLPHDDDDEGIMDL